MGFTPRSKQILKIMLEENQKISVKKLAEKSEISKRTVQRELEYIDSDLKKYEIALLSKTGVGIWLEGKEEAKQRLYMDLVSGDSYDVSNKQERQKRLILEILKDKGLKKLFYYSSKFKVSEATISADLHAVENWLNQYGLFVERKPGSGVSIQGNEENYRRAIRVFISENIDTGVLREAYEKEMDWEENCKKLQKSNIGQILNNDILKQVISCISKINDDRMMTLTENSYIGLVIHITIAINRILKHETIQADAKWTEELPKDKEYLLAKKIVDELEDEFKIEIPEVEISYICLHIKGAKHEKIEWNEEKLISIENQELQKLVNKMIDIFDTENAFLLKQDEEFIQGLLAHLQPTFVRILHDMQITNPVLEEIKQNYPDIYLKCQKVAQILSEWLEKPVPEAEIGFLTVHFGAAMVRLEEKKENIRLVHVGIICSSGIGISRLMSSKIEKTFRGRIVVSTYGKNDITPYICGKTDFFVSSISFEPTNKIPIIFVNPLLSETDIEKIRQLIHQFERSPKKQDKTEDSIELDEVNLLATQIQTVVKYMELLFVKSDICFEQLLEKISSTLSPYQDRANMIQEDIWRRENIATQIFAEFGFALFHTRTKGVIRPSFTICLPENKSNFLDPYFKNISVAFVMLVPVDDFIKTNSEILGYISSMLIEDFSFMEIVLTGNEKLIRDSLYKKLKKFFLQYIEKM